MQLGDVFRELGPVPARGALTMLESGLVQIPARNKT